MHHLIQKIEKEFIRKVPAIRPGYTVSVHQKIREGEKERVQVFEGLVIGFNAGYGSSKMMRVRKIVEGIGVEKIFPLYSKIITKIEVKKRPKVRRAKLFYMRGLTGKSARLRAGTALSEKDLKYGKKKSNLLEGMGVDLENAQAEAEPEVSETATAAASADVENSVPGEAGIQQTEANVKEEGGADKSETENTEKA